MVRPHPKRQVFTLVELLAVIAIIAIVAALLFPVVAQARSGGRGIFMSRVRATEVAHSLYSMDYDDDDLAPNGIHWNRRHHELGGHGHGHTGNGISYHGGPVILGTVNVYYIWYGNWSGNSATTILADLAQNIGGSPYFNINTTYYDGALNHVSGLVHYGGSTTDNYSHGTSLTDAAIQAVVSSAITANKLPKDTNGVYFVLTSADVNASSGFCTQYCGWHTHGTISGSDIKYAFVGNPDRCPANCSMQVDPNDNAGADGMASIISHELEEATTDPDLNAWFDSRGFENADKCAWTFGSTYTTSNGSTANMKLGTRDFLIQQNWVNASGGYCAKSYP
jgi:prepilin-type N-terminal cleavage/methylation domain-containing protein